MEMSLDLLDNLPAVWTVLSRAPAGLITDVDGTISPIVDTPGGAGVHPRARAALYRLAGQLKLVAALSGRPVDQVAAMVDVEGMVYVGNHGLEWLEEGRTEIVSEAKPYLPAVAESLRYLRERLGFPGLLVEDKGITGTAHYRLSPDPEAARQAILDALAQSPTAQGLHISEGRKVVNLRPPVRADKGTAVERLVRERGLLGAIYLGDDVTDLDAFRAMSRLRRSGECDAVSVAVTSPEAPAELLSEADYRLDSVEAVAVFLEEAARQLYSSRPHNLVQEP